MKKEADVILADIDRRYIQLCSGSDNFNSLPLLLTELQLCLSLQVYAISTRAAASSSGLVTTQRHWWRYRINISILHSELMFWCCFQIYLPTLKGYVPDDMIRVSKCWQGRLNDEQTPHVWNISRYWWNRSRASCMAASNWVLRMSQRAK